MLLPAAIFGMLGFSSLDLALGEDPTGFLVSRGRSYFDIASNEILLPPLPTHPARPVVTALAASDNGQFLAAAGDDHSIRIVETQSGDAVKTLLGHTDWVQSLVFAENSQVLYSAGNDGRVFKWSGGRLDQPIELIRLPYALRCISVSSHQHLLAIGGFSGEILLYDLKGMKIRFRLACKSQDQRCVRFSPDGMHVLCGGRDGRLTVWRTVDGSLIAEFHEHAGRVQTAAFSSDGWSVTSAGEDRQIIRYDLKSGKIAQKRKLKTTKLMSMCMINDDFIAVAGSDNAIHLYDAGTDEIVAKLQGHFGTVATMCPAGERLVSGSYDTSIRVWDLNSVANGVSQINKPVSRSLIKIDERLRIR
jgi:WD40 repeat protein